MKEKTVLQLISEAKLGNQDAKDELICNNYTLIRKISINTYEIIKNELALYNSNYILSNCYIELDDITQDLCIKSIGILENYLNQDYKEYFSSYLNDKLKAYTNTYINKTLKNIKKKYDFETIKNTDPTFKKIVDNSQYQNLIDEIKFFINNDVYLKKYENFINDILSCCSYKELSKITNLNKRRINMKINHFVELYNSKKELLKSFYELSEEYILNNIKKGKIYNIECYRFILDKYINSIYKEINKYHDVDFKEIQKEVLYLINNDISNSFKDNNKNVDQVNKTLKKSMKERKYYYIRKKTK